MSKKLINTGISICLGLLFNGCTNQPLIANVTSYSDIDKNFSYSKPLILRGPKNNIIKSQLVLTNKSMNEQNIEYRLKWYDKNGFEIKSISSKADIALIEPNKELVISKIAPNKHTYSLEFYVKTPHGEKSIHSNKMK